MNKITKFLAVALAACGVVALAACGSSKNTTATSPNWNTQVNVDDLTSANDAWFTRKEVATYSLSFKDGGNTSYTISYDESSATYTTTFYAKKDYDWSNEQIPDGYRSESSDTENIYVYETTLSISGTLTHTSSKKSVDIADSVTTITYFRSADNNLQPIYSYQSIENIFPANLTASDLSSSYRKMHRVYETYYNKKCTKALITTTYSSDDYEYNANKPVTQTTVGGLDDTGYSLFDANMIATALRSFSYGSHTFSLLIPINGAVSTYKSSSASAKTLDKTDDATIITALNNAGDYLFVGSNTDGDKVYKYNSISLSLSAEMSGSSNTYWFANIASSQVNSTRAVMLKMVTPIYFGAGTLTYTLSSLETTTIE
jgi:hypothetical protein